VIGPRRHLAVIGAILLAVLSGCARPPSKEMDAAMVAVNRFTPLTDAASTLADAARDSLFKAEDEFKVQAEKFAIFRKYDRARGLIASSRKLIKQANEKNDSGDDNGSDSPAAQ